MTTRTFERTLAEWAAQTANAHSDAARAVVGAALLDITGCIIGGSVEPATRAIARVAQQFLGKASCGEIEQGFGASPCAAFVLGTAAHALDFDDNFGPAVTHATAVLAPALLSLAAEEDLSGADVVDAYIVGLELQARIGRLVNPEHYEKGWHATSTIGTIGTAGGCARLLRLNEEQTLAAMSIASSMAGGSKQQFGSMLKPIHAGLAAKNAVLAAHMARAGISADPVPLTGQWGFAELSSDASKVTAREELALQALGETLAIETDGLLIKRFPCCGAAHRTLDGLVELRRQNTFALEDVGHIDAYVPAFARANLRFDDPRDPHEARFSLTYCAARVLESGRLALGDLAVERVRDSSLRPLLRWILVHTKSGSVSDELGASATAALTRVVLHNGQGHEIGVRWPKGSKHVPLTADETREKFNDCCRWAGVSAESARLYELARSVAESPRISELFGALSEIVARA